MQMTAAGLLTLACLLLMHTTAECSTTYLSGSRRYCGSSLANVLDLVCDGIFKRGDQGLHLSTDYQDSSRSEYDLITNIFKGRSHAMSTVKREQLGVATECCANPCDFTVLSSYCGKRED